ncbi:2122_t:CDS:2 [Funneliformis mosseae]|uniref:2122_t:CDS:1 n=1 Tax=Funneliformis mosseae TaxID=27381 RepID=A0A9N9BS02_FUNMO|nr:2122_t:CDS:2 [Funneliformis mosseae]
MPFINEYGDKYYWKEQLDFEHEQYTVFSHNRSNLQSWLDDKKNTFDSLMKYAKNKQEVKEFKEWKSVCFSRLTTNFIPPALYKAVTVDEGSCS